MEKTAWEKVLEIWGRNFYAEPIWFFFMLIAIFIGLKFYRKEKTYFYFILYTISGLILFPSLLVIIGSNKFNSRQKTLFIETFNTIYSIIEIFTFYYYYYYIIKTKSILLLMKFCFLIVILLSIVFFLKLGDSEVLTSELNSFSFLINSTEFFFLLLPCLVYFYESFNLKINFIKPLKEIPSFWVSTGLFFYITVSLPLLLIGNNLISYNLNIFDIMFSLHYLSLSILFICLSKAFSCKTPLIT